jgi:hypothetical protein
MVFIGRALFFGANKKRRIGSRVLCAANEKRLWRVCPLLTKTIPHYLTLSIVWKKRNFSPQNIRSEKIQNDMKLTKITYLELAKVQLFKKNILLRSAVNV